MNSSTVPGVMTIRRLLPYSLVLAVGLGCGILIDRHHVGRAESLKDNLLVSESMKLSPVGFQERELSFTNRSVLRLQVEDSSGDACDPPQFSVTQDERLIEGRTPRQTEREYEVSPGPCKVAVLNVSGQTMNVTLRATAASTNEVGRQSSPRLQ